MMFLIFVPIEILIRLSVKALLILSKMRCIIITIGNIIFVFIL